MCVCWQFICAVVHCGGSKSRKPMEHESSKKAQLELCPRWRWERAVAPLRVQEAGLLWGQQGGRARERAPGCGQGSGAQGSGRFAGVGPRGLLVVACGTWPPRDVPNGMSSRRSVVRARVKLICAFILEFPSNSQWLWVEGSIVILIFMHCLPGVTAGA